MSEGLARPTAEINLQYEEALDMLPADTIKEPA